MSVARDIGRTLWPAPGDAHGPLAPMLVLLTVATGLVDAVSYIKLGHVFVANMTGNVVFLGFAIAGASGLSTTASLAAVGSFLAGAFAGGRLGARTSAHRGHLLRAAVAVEVLLVAAALLVAIVQSNPVSNGSQYALILLLALAMGVQNASARRLGVPDLTTTVLTLTLTGVAADSRAAGGAGARLGRRLVAVTAMLVGALVGGLLAVRVSMAAPLAVAVGLLASIAICAQVLSGSLAAWTGTAPSQVTTSRGPLTAGRVADASVRLIEQFALGEQRLEGIEPSHVIRGRFGLALALRASGNRRDEVPSEVRPRSARPLEHDNAHPQRPSLPRLLEHQLPVIARQLGVDAERIVHRRKLGRVRAHAIAFARALGTAVPIMQSRVTIAASSSSLQPSVLGGRIGSTR
jgi:uncharacterized membrane protein YoaK (UPF0700 family)